MINFSFLPKLTCFFLLVTLHYTANAQNATIIDPPPYIKTVQLHNNVNDNYTPIIALGEALYFSFDDINANEVYYSYRIDHCDYNWNISNLVSTEYMTGYREDRIRNYTNSFNTLQGYTHYKLKIPNENNRITKTGNYIISVLDEDYNVVFNRRFIIYQPRVQVAVTAHRTTEVTHINQKQSVQFKIHHPNIQFNDPVREIKVAIYQNGDWNSVIKNIPPKYIQNNLMLYNYPDEISFWAGNEYLYFDTKEIRNATNNVFKSVLNNIFDTYLYTNEFRANRPYTFYPDINGNFVVRTIDAEDSATEADYSWVHFSLENNLEIGSDPIYVYGSFNDWKIGPENQLNYNKRTNTYEGKILFKQGFYNYKFVSAKNVLEIQPNKICGSFYQTENDYIVLVYYRPFGSRYDQVIGYGQAKSDRLNN